MLFREVFVFLRTGVESSPKEPQTDLEVSAYGFLPKSVKTKPCSEPMAVKGNARPSG